MATKVLIADDHTIVRRGLRLLIDADDRFDVVAEAADGSEAVRNCKEKRPDVAVLDVNMPRSNGITAAAEIRNACPETGIVMLTFQAQLDVIRAAIGAGANAYVLKDSTEGELFDAIVAAAAGRRYMSQRASEVMVESFIDIDADDTASSAHGALRGLSTRERQVLQMLAEGSSNNHIAETLNLSPKTVETYRSRLMRKLEVTSFAALVRIAVREGLVDRQG